MTIYQFYCFVCNKNKEINISMNLRDEPQKCECENILRRKISFKGVVYSNTHNGGMK